MKVLFLNYEYPPLGGGAANATAYILREYSKMPGLEVELVTSSIDGKYHLEQIGENVKVHKLPIGKNEKNLHFQSQKDLLAYSWKAYIFSRHLVRRAKKDAQAFDLTHSFFTVPCGFLSMLLKWEFGLPYVVSLRGSDVPGYSNRFPLIYALAKPGFRLIWKKAAAVVSNSEGLKELALKTNPKQKIDTIPNGIDTEKFKPDENDDSERYTFVITPGASRLTARKGLVYLLEAVSELAKNYSGIRVEIMGEGDEKENLEKKAADLKIEGKVHFLGRIPREKTPGYYREADLFVLPSLNEGMSNAMLEALASGLPILATDSGGIKELVKDGQNGYIIEMKNAADIAAKIRKLLLNPPLRKKMGEESRKKALEMNWSKVAEEYGKLYKKVKS